MDKTHSLVVAALIVMASGGRSRGTQENPAAAPVIRAQAPIGPLGHWKGDDGAAPKQAADASGNGFHGTYSAGAGTSTEVPKTDFPDPGCISLDGVTGVVTVPDSPALRITGDITIAFWKRRTAEVKDWTRLVGKGNGAQRNFGVWEFPNGDGRIKFQMYNTGGQSVLEVDSPTGTPLNTWHHVVCTVSVNSAALYMNGALVANGMRTGEPGTSADPLTFGFAGYHAYYPGQLDDIRIYDRALSMNEIVYLAAGHGPPAGPTDLAATHAAGQPVALRWTSSATVPPAGTATYYLVKRSTTKGSGYATVAWGVTRTTYIDPTAEPRIGYYYIVTALNTGGESVPSNELAVAPASK